MVKGNFREYLAGLGEAFGVLLLASTDSYLVPVVFLTELLYRVKEKPWELPLSFLSVNYLFKVLFGGVLKFAVVVGILELSKHYSPVL